MALAERGGGRDGDVDAHGLGDGGGGGTADEAHQFGADFGDLAAIFRGGVGLGGEFLDFIAQLGGLPGSQRLEVVHHGGLDAGAGDQRAFHAIEELAAHGDFKCGALAAAGGVRVAGVRYLLLLG